MITRLQLIRNIGLFGSYTGSPDEDFGRLTLIYAENGQGKTTISAIFRSLETGDPIPIQERARLGTDHPPHVVLNHGDGTTSVFQDNVWSSSSPSLWIFDDAFVHENVHAGLGVAATHRQNLHDVIIGRQGVRLARAVEQKTDDIASMQRAIRDLESNFDRSVMAGLDIDAFCALETVPNVDDLILEATRRVGALARSTEVQSQVRFSPFSPPDFPIDEITACLETTLEDISQGALTAVSEHFSAIGAGGEGWVSGGMEFAERLDGECPFCEQDLKTSDIFLHYQAYFDEAYRQHLGEIRRLEQSLETDFSGDALAAYQRDINRTQELYRFWSKFTDLPDFAIDTDLLADAWRAAREALSQLLTKKQADPLTGFQIGAEEQEKLRRYAEGSRLHGEMSRALAQSNPRIDEVKEATAEGAPAAAEAGLSLLRASKARQEAPHSTRCDERREALSAKGLAEEEKERVRGELDDHRTAVFPRYQNAINEILARFNASFRIVRLEPTNPRGLPSSQYFLEVNRQEVPVSSEGVQGVPTFRSTLSGGDRTTLAFAFFIAALQGEPSLQDDIVVIDDPLSSLDDHRRAVTSQEIQALVPKTHQMIVLSHSKHLLCSLWKNSRQGEGVPLEIRLRNGDTSLVPWNIHDDAVTEYDKRHERLRQFLRDGGTREDAKRVAVDLRPVLEGFFRVYCTEHFHPGDLLRDLTNRARQALVAGSDPIFTQAELDSITQLIEYANRFHHETNPAYDRALEDLNEQELRGFAETVRDFTTPPGT